MVIENLLNWFAGGSHRYMTLTHCMQHDMPWIGLTVLLDLAVASGYILIAFHWRRNAKPLENCPAKTALRNMKNIFVFCGLCGYLFIPIKMYWPAWRLYDMFLGVLVYYTWRYALAARDLKVIYNELGRSARLVHDLEESREESKRKSYFLNAISHDLKTPLNGLMLQAELAELNLSTNDVAALHESLAEIKSCARTTAELLNSFLEIGRLDWAEETLQPEPVELGELLRKVISQSRARGEHKGLTMSLDVPSPLIVRTDHVKVERIVQNLVDNAIKFTHNGVVQLHVDAGRSEVSIHVVDTGEGIAEGHLGHIFNDFTQVNNRERDSRKGFGLGLAIARRLARKIGGDLTVASALGRGSRFTLLLPVTFTEARAPGPSSGSSGSQSASETTPALG
jgi:signal transduction histidine kinase